MRTILLPLLMLIAANMDLARCADQTITVTAYPLWTDTGITLQSTDSVRIHDANGQWTGNIDNREFVGPDGAPYSGTFNVWLTDGRIWDLIGFIGDTPYGIAPNDPRLFAIGSGSVSLSDKSGKLWLGFNDAYVTGWWDNVGSITVIVSAGCQAEVKVVKMDGAGRLHVQVQGEFSQSGLTSKALGVSTTISGAALEQTVSLAAGVTGRQLQSLFLDLAALNVPRFGDNITLRIIPKMVEGGRECQGTEGDGIILLPTIIVPGIFNGSGGNGTYPLLEAFLRDKNKTIGNLLGEPYRLETDVTEYPTLFTLSYQTTSATFDAGARSLDDLVTRIKRLTYADRVNVVGHSKGGLVGREYTVSRAPFAGPFPVPSVNRLIMCQSPNTGALKAAWDQVLPGGRFTNLLPLWPWSKRNGRTDMGFQQEGENRELEALNNLRLPSEVKYRILYSRNYRTQITRTGPPPYSFGYDDGDGVVPTASMLGVLIDPNIPGFPGSLIPAFQGIPMQVLEIPGAHSNYLQQPDVMSALASLLQQ